MNQTDISKFKQLFIEEATGLLNSMEGIILELENNPEDLKLIQEVFRVMHTIKGVCGMYGFQGMSDLTHNVENIYALIRNGLIAIDKEILNLTLASVDQLFALMDDQEVKNKKNAKKQEELLAWCNQVLKTKKQSGSATPYVFEKQKHEHVTYNIILHINQELLDRNINVYYVLKDIADIGEIKAINRLPSETNEEERWSIFVVGDITAEDVEEAVMFAFEYCIVRKVANYDIFNNKEMQDLQQAIIDEELAHQQKGEDAAPVQSVAASGNMARQISNSQTTIESIRKNMNRVSVDSEKLDYLMYLVSELITTTSQLNLITHNNGLNVIHSQMEKLDKLSKLFRNNALDIRLIPIRDMVPKFNRLVRDISMELGKEVEFATEGMETELDKNSIDLIAEPLVHMLRNALDHGIETPEERLEAGKTAKGVIQLKAYNSGNNIFIEVTDNGRGIDSKNILAKAIEKGLVAKGDKLDEKEIFNLLCMPGFSTASEITSISGRGVGMDVVRQKIVEMRGELDISSQVGKGSKFTIKLQQSIAILDTLLIRAGNMKCLLPLSDVEVCSQCEYNTIDRRERHGTIDFEQELVPFVSLPGLFELDYKKPNMAKIIIVKKNKTRYAIVADEIIGQHQAVLKPMGELIKTHKEISAASVLGNGEVAYLLDTGLFDYRVKYSVQEVDMP
jgi:two-component system chemotaxis sensor kinase CheA